MMTVIAYHHVALPSPEAVEQHIEQLETDLQTLIDEGELLVHERGCSGRALVPSRPSWLTPRVRAAIDRAGSSLEIEHETEDAGQSIHLKTTFYERRDEAPE